MTDEPRDDEPRPEITGALAVPPLDDVTRRRLVHNALDASAPAPADVRGEPEKRSWAPLVAAAVVVLLVVAGFVALGRGGDDSSSDTAARRDDRTGTAASPEASSGAATADTAVHVVDLGDFGDLSGQDARTAALTRIAATDTAQAAPAPTDLVTKVGQAACAAPLRAAGVSVVGIGSATVDGRDAAVVTVTQNADGSRKTYLLVFSPCALTAL